MSRTATTTPRGFSLTEILVVISILVILIAISVPAFKTLISNSERTLSENQIRVGLSAGRDAAIRAESGDGAAVFLFAEGRLRMVACVSVGFLIDTLETTGEPIRREVFAPVANIEPVTLPGGWSVRGYATPGTFESPVNACGWYENFPGRALDGNWVFPETHFVSFEGSGVEARGVQRHSFMVRFKNASGTLDTADRSAVLVLDRVNDQSFRGAAPFSTARADQAANLVAFARRVLNNTSLTAEDKRRLLGDESIDTILVRPVTEVAMYEESTMIGRIGGRPNRETGTLYLPPDPAAAFATFDPASLPAGLDQDETQARINQWIQGQLDLGGSNAVESDARIFMLQRYLGQVQEITP
ncbi:MAG: hypothetical protein HBSAPP03_29220 [Phycisphaerae bacterium]|nr:MAG: hypothetical protein HBSAPP03_29220 [Phycisphaerae bacterium]